jgi:hypothetical protein
MFKTCDRHLGKGHGARLASRVGAAGVSAAAAANAAATFNAPSLARAQGC